MGTENCHLQFSVTQILGWVDLDLILYFFNLASVCIHVV